MAETKTNADIGYWPGSQDTCLSVVPTTFARKGREQHERSIIMMNSPLVEAGKGTLFREA